MSMILMAKAMGVRVGNASRKLVLLKLADNANDNGECWPSYQHIADQCEMSRRSVISHIDELIKQGLVVKIERKKDAKLNQSNVYVLNLDAQKPVDTDSIGGENSALGGENISPVGSATVSLGGENTALGGSENSAPRTYHSSEPVNEPINIICAQGANTQPKTQLAPKPKKPKTRITAQDLINDYWVSEQIANEYLEVRGKSLLTPTALKTILNESEKLGWTLEQALTACCAEGWKGFKANWIKNQQWRENQNQPEYLSAEASMKRLTDTSWG